MTAYLREFQSATREIKTDKAEKREPQKWRVPGCGQYKINVDGALKGSRAGIGAILRDYAGQIMAV